MDFQVDMLPLSSLESVALRSPVSARCTQESWSPHGRVSLTASIEDYGEVGKVLPLVAFLVGSLLYFALGIRVV